MILVIDYIGGRHITIRRRDDFLVIRSLDHSAELELNADEWIELVGLIVAIKAARDFQEA